MRTMCRCCQNCWEDFYWNCIEERFCYDESIANYNPDDDDEYLTSKTNGNAFGRIQPADNNNLPGSQPICSQPLGRGSGIIMMGNAKIHEEDYRRETQMNVPMLGPEILAVFANSQIFQDHQPTKLNRINTKSYLAGVHAPHKETAPLTTRKSDQDHLLRRLEANFHEDELDDPKTATTQIGAITSEKITTQVDMTDASQSPEKRITFTLTIDSSPGSSHLSISSKKFDAITEEEPETETVAGFKYTDSHNTTDNNTDNDEIILRPRLIDRRPHILLHGHVSPQKRMLCSLKSMPHFHVRSVASETDIFAITSSGGRISMTPEVPSISFSNLPKNYEDTPTIEKYRVSQSLYSIQATNAARVTHDDYSMPRYFRRSAMMTQSSEGLSEQSMTSMVSATSQEDMRRTEKEKSKRLQMLRGKLPPLLIHSVSFRKNRDKSKRVD